MKKIFNIIINNGDVVSKDYLEKISGRKFHRLDYDGFNVGDIIRGYARNGRLIATFIITEKIKLRLE